MVHQHSVVRGGYQNEKKGEIGRGKELITSLIAGRNELVSVCGCLFLNKSRKHSKRDGGKPETAKTGAWGFGRVLKNGRITLKSYLLLSS